MTRKKQIKFIISYFLFFLFASFPNSCAYAIIEGKTNENLNTQTGAIVSGSGFSYSVSVGSVTGVVIKGFISLLGIIFLVLIVLDGYKYMMARDNKEDTKKALDGIRHAIIGLVIMVAAYAITGFVFKSLDNLGDTAGSGGINSAPVN